jgi:hypothetical protein
VPQFAEHTQTKRLFIPNTVAFHFSAALYSVLLNASDNPVEKVNVFHVFKKKSLYIFVESD